MKDIAQLSKCVWTDADFEQMGWHDANMYAIAVVPHFVDDGEGWGSDVMIDLDYIVKWIEVGKGRKASFHFAVAPATLVFKDVRGFEAEFLVSGGADDQNQLHDIIKLPPSDEPDERPGDPQWIIEGVTDTFTAAGFSQHFRAQPTYSLRQQLQMEQRGGISFATPDRFTA
jgi:hypothetical protein